LQVIDNKYETIEDTSCIQNVSKMDTQVRLGKDRLGEENILLSVDSEQQKVVKIPYEEIKILYTEILVNPFPVCRFLSDKRKKLIKARWREQLPDLNSWKEYFSRIAESDFLMGRTTGKTGKPFLCSLDWILNQSNCIKILECTYSNGRWD
jgi:hypothetical protein